MHIMGSPLCDDYNSGRSILYPNTHLAKHGLQCDEELHYIVPPENLDLPRFLLCSNCGLHNTAAIVQSSDQRFSLCQTCVSKANNNRFCDGTKNNFGRFCSPDHVLDSYGLSPPSSFIDRHCGFPLVPLPPNNGDSSSPLPNSEIFQNFDNYTKNNTYYQQVPILHPDYLDIHKDSSCSGFDGYYQTKEENVWLNNFDGYNFAAEDFIFTELISEIPRGNPTEIFSSSSVHKDYSIEAMANASSQDYNIKNQMIGSSKANEQRIFSNNLVQLDYGPSQLILSDEMLPREARTFSSRLQARQEALKRYFAKKKKRKFGKQIRYESRKYTADTKRRMKGRFTKAGAEYDFDPRANYNKEPNGIMTK